MPFQIRYIQVATLAEYLTRLLKNKWIVVSIFILKVIVFTNRDLPRKNFYDFPRRVIS